MSETLWTAGVLQSSDCSDCSDWWVGIAGAAINLVAVLIAWFTLLHAGKSFNRQLRNSNYTEIDRLYFDLVSLGLSRELSERLDNATRRDAFDNAYSLLLWNFIETIHDRCDGDRKLYKTWEPILLADGKKDIAWFREAENRSRFKPKFQRWVDKTFPAAVA